jgi:hypothetical protein
MPSPLRGAHRRALVLVAAASATLSCMKPPTQKDLANGQLLNDVTDAITSLQQGSADLQARVDSLTLVVARQDTLLRQLASIAGVQVPAR